MTLSRWIESEGPKNIAKKLKVDPSTVSLWKRGRTFPPAKVLVRLHKLSNGRVSYDEMIHHFASSKARKNNGRAHAR